MNNFIYKNKCEIIFGDLPESEVASAIKRHGASKVMLVYGSGSVVKNGLLGKIKKSLEEQVIDYVEYGGVVANPLVSHGVEGIRIAREEKVDFVLAVGGGSVIDEAKFIAVGAIKGQDAWKIYKNFAIDGIDALPMASVLTIPAAGSECSTASVMRCDKTGIKYSIVSEVIRPKFAFINPRHCMTLPKEQVGYGASDIFAHLLERYLSPQANVIFTDKILEGAMKSMLEIAPMVYKVQSGDISILDGAYKDGYGVWSEFCLIGTLAHNGWLSLGRDVQDWATHRMENKLLSGIHNIAHGAGLAILFPAWMKHVSKTKPTKIAQFAREVMGINGKNDNAVIKKAIVALQEYFKSMGLANTLGEIEIDYKIVKKDARKIFKSDTILGGYGEIGSRDIQKIIDLAK
ncbi:MAG: iron-containing alcohol dehydrogenase [Firmicutes bacterium]|nr:iron-containing alcohol dehydrogenase [Bacillota bacterium]